MPLTPFQREVARVLATNRNPESHIAGGAVINRGESGLRISDDLDIWRWETDWTNYFEAGREWWGEYLWTVHRPGSGRVAVIAGSSTD